MRKKRHLTIEEKRDWLASIFRDESGDFSQADKFKAMTEDTRLAQLQEEKENSSSTASTPHPTRDVPALLAELLPPPMP